MYRIMCGGSVGNNAIWVKLETRKNVKLTSLVGDGCRHARALLHARPQHQIQLEVFTQDALGEEENGGVVFAARPI